MLHNMSEQAFRDHATDSGLLNEALLDGDCTAATQFLHSNTVAQKVRRTVQCDVIIDGLGDVRTCSTVSGRLGWNSIAPVACFNFTLALFLLSIYVYKLVCLIKQQNNSRMITLWM